MRIDVDVLDEYRSQNRQAAGAIRRRTGAALTHFSADNAATDLQSIAASLGYESRIALNGPMQPVVGIDVLGGDN